MSNHRVKIILHAAWIAVLLPAVGVAGDWPQWRGANRDGFSTDTGLLKKWPASGPKLVWKAEGIGGGYSTPSVSQGGVFLMGDKVGDCCLVALNASTGDVVWEAKLGDAGGHKKYPGPRSTPTVDVDAVYTLTQNGDLFCLQRKTGKVVWKKNLEDDFDGKMMSGWRWTESVLVDGDRLLCTPGGDKGTVLALDKKSGKPLWRCKELTDPASYSSIMPWEHGGVRQYVQFTGKSVAGIDAETGKLLWRHDRPGKTAVVTMPVMKDNMVFVTSAYGIGCTMFEVELSGQGFTTTEAYANKDMMNHHGGVVLVGDHVYGTGGKNLVCMELSSGEVVWEDECVRKGSIAYADGMLIVRGERDGSVALVEASPDGYRERGRFTMPDFTEKQSWPHPVIANGHLFLRDQDNLFCYRLKK
jgi:outer membrane protein assembly factor BamB